STGRSCPWRFPAKSGALYIGCHSGLKTLSYQGLKSWIKESLGWTLTIAKHGWTGVHGFWCAPGQQPPTIPSGFHVLPRRWVVERTFAWLSRNRRLAKDYERLPETGQTFIYMAMSRILIKRLAK